jgi:hypothetical protein
MSDTAVTPDQFIESLDEPRKGDMARLDRLIQEVVPELDRQMYGEIIGYGGYHYRYASGREGDWFKLGLASQKAYISLYATGVEGKAYVAERFKDRLPKASIGKSCVRFKRVDDLDEAALRELIRAAADASVAV